MDKTLWLTFLGHPVYKEETNKQTTCAPFNSVQLMIREGNPECSKVKTRQACECYILRVGGLQLLSERQRPAPLVSLPHAYAACRVETGKHYTGSTPTCMMSIHCSVVL